MKPVRLTALAEEDLEAAGDFYDFQHPILRERFIDRIVSALETISENPKTCVEIVPGIHKYALKGFPYSIVFREESEVVTVIAVAHQKRDPETWVERY